ncbi:MAG: helix-turn-helix transcriptional regulator [Ruminococcaceae bacterium]|nr:helix-turn-helix transcriptional regulator [Oscillospiraceae bacterium]
MAISDKIKEYRVKRGMTQAQLAELLGMTPQSISKWERATGYPDLSAICPLADALGITTDELLEHKNPPGELNKKWYRLMRKCDMWQAPLEDLIALDNDAISQYPNDELFLWRRVSDEFKLACRKTDAGEKQQWLACAEEHCAELIAKDPNWENSKYMMVKILMECGRTDEAIAWAHKCKSPDEAMKDVLRGNDLRRHHQQIIDDVLRDLLGKMRCKDLDFLKASEDIIRAVFPDGNYQYYYDFLMMIEFTRAKYYSDLGDSAKTMEYLYRALDVAKEKFIKGKSKFTIPIFDELPPEGDDMSLIEQLYGILQHREGLETVFFTDEYQKLLANIKGLISVNCQKST